MMEEDVEASEEIRMELAKESARLDAECTAEEVEQEVAWYWDGMGSILDATAQRIRICTKSRRWRNTDNKDR